MKWLLMLMGGFCAGATMHMLATEPWREVIGLAVAGAAIAVGSLLLVLAEDGADG